MTVIGIDLGTTNSLAAYWTDDSGPVIIPNSLGERLTPSVVSVDDDGDILVGQAAKERLITHPHLTAAAFKRSMGTAKPFSMGNHVFLPEELSSLVLRSLKEDAEAFFGEAVTEAVISVPAYFNDTQRKATLRASELAGLKVERLLNEPTAAAIAYGLHQKEATRFVVFDLGGGTFDVSVMDLFEGIMEVKAIAGDNFLGGEDFTDLLIFHFLQYHQLERDSLDAKTYVALKKQAELCKRKLSQEKFGTMRVAFQDQDLAWTASRDEFAAAARDLINRFRRPIERALQDAALSSAEMEDILLVGGATRMPLVHAAIGKMFGRLPSCRINPDEVVVMGAAIQAAMKERNILLKEVVLTDVCPYTLGTNVVIRLGEGRYEDGHFAPIIERNTVIPASKVKRFFTMHDNQKDINVEIYQGESRLTKNNIKLGELDIPVPLAPAGEQAVDVRYTYDINGILEVEVTVVQTGIKKRAVIEKTPGVLSKKEIEARLENLAALKIHPRDRMENRALVARGERLYEESLADKRLEIDQALQRFEEALQRQNDREIKQEARLLKVKLDQFDGGQDF